jgi:tetratricopeptide (TPR) repeat protein
MSSAASDPLETDALRREGQVLFQQGRLPQAEAVVRRALLLDPADPRAHNNLGAVLARQGRHADALACFDQALRLRPDYATAHHNRGNALRDLGRHADALPCYADALRLRPQAADVAFDLGLALLALRRPAEAVPHLRRSTQQRPGHAESHHRLAQVLAEHGDLAGAADSYRRAAELRPRSPVAHHNLGVTLAALGRLPDAIASLREALRLAPADPERHNSLGLVLGDAGVLDESAAAFREALRLNPAYAEAHNNLGITLGKQGDLDGAHACFAEALRLRPDYAKAHKNRALAWLQQGDYPRGWPEYEWRWQTPEFKPRSFAESRWEGGSLAGRPVLLYAEQGLGDTLQFSRYAPLVRARGGRVLVEAPPRLVPLLRRCPGIDGLVARGEALPDFAVQAPLLSVPGLLGTTLETVPAAVPYLSADPELVRRWGERLRAVPGVKVGIVWQGSAGYADDRHRSIPLRHFEPLARLPGVRLVSLQKGPGAEQLATAAAGWDVLDLGPELDESSGAFMDSAAILAHLDLVVCSDTALAHLAGALGVTTWLALPRPCDWRWGLEGERTPWYPTLRLFRQTHRGDWDGVFARLALALQERLASGVPADGRPTSAQ